MKIRILMGLPGSGKSTWIKNNTYGYVTVCSTDHFHTSELGYNHPGRDAERTKQAHGYNLRKFISAIQEYVNTPSTCIQPPSQFLVVDNTNTTQYELGPYLAVVNAYGLNSCLEVHYLRVTPEVSKVRNVHRVPHEVVDLMASNLENLLANWPKPWPAPVIHDLVEPENCSSCFASPGQGHDMDCNASRKHKL